MKLPPNGHWTEGTRVILEPIKSLTSAAALDRPFYFQVPPMDNFSIAHSANHTDYDTIGREQLSRAGAVQLRTTSFQTLLLDYDAPWAAFHRDGTLDTTDDEWPMKSLLQLESAYLKVNPNWQSPLRRNLPPLDPILVAQRLRKILESRTPVRLSVGQSQVWGRWDLQMPATLRTMTVTERAGEPQDRYVDVAFTEYRQPTSLKSASSARYHGKLPAVLTVHEDGSWYAAGIHTKFKPTLHNFAAYFYGAPSAWRWIAKHPQNRKLLAHVRPTQDLREVAKKATKGKVRHKHGGWVKLTVPRSPHQAAKDHKRDKK